MTRRKQAIVTEGIVAEPIAQESTGEILVHQRSRGDNWQAAKQGDVWHLFIHGTQYSPALRSAPPPCKAARGLTRWAEPDALRAGGPLARRAAGMAAAGAGVAAGVG